MNVWTIEFVTPILLVWQYFSNSSATKPTLTSDIRWETEIQQESKRPYVVSENVAISKLAPIFPLKYCNNTLFNWFERFACQSLVIYQHYAWKIQGLILFSQSNIPQKHATIIAMINIKLHFKFWLVPRTIEYLTKLIG